MKIDINKVKVGDIFSEESHYVMLVKTSRGIHFKHVESDNNVTIDTKYVTSLLKSADQYIEVKEVTREDKKDGTLGIRSIFEGIHSGQVFTVVFKKQDTPKTKRQLNEERKAQRQVALGMIDKAKKQKKSMADAYKEALEYIQDNPIKEFNEGDLRTLRGYKLQFNSRDGKYRCLDMDIQRSDKESGERLVNINTIQELIYDGIKYIVK